MLACIDVPFGYWLLWGFLAREGMPEGEALGLTWDCVDLMRGMVRLDENKTHDPLRLGAIAGRCPGAPELP